MKSSDKENVCGNYRLPWFLFQGKYGIILARRNDNASGSACVSGRILCGIVLCKEGSADDLASGALLQFYLYVCGDHDLPGQDGRTFSGAEDVPVL